MEIIHRLSLSFLFLGACSNAQLSSLSAPKGKSKATVVDSQQALSNDLAEQGDRVDRQVLPGDVNSKEAKSEDVKSEQAKESDVVTFPAMISGSYLVECAALSLYEVGCRVFDEVSKEPAADVSGINVVLYDEQGELIGGDEIKRIESASGGQWQIVLTITTQRVVKRVEIAVASPVTPPVETPVPSSPFNLTGVIDNPNATIPDGSYANLTTNGGFGWQTQSTSKDVQTNGYQFTIDSGNGNVLNYSGSISGSGSVVLVSAATFSSCCVNVPLVFEGTKANTYTGLTTLKQGIIQLGRSAGTTVIPGDVVMENQGSNDELRWVSSDQIADTANLDIRSVAGKLNLNGVSETVASVKMVNGSLLLIGAAGKLTVKKFWYDNQALAAGTYTKANATFLQGDGTLVVTENTQDLTP